MAEPRRIPLLAVKPANKNTDTLGIKKKSQDKEKEKEKEKEIGPTLRFSLKLGDSNDDAFPEYSFKELIRKAEHPKSDEGKETKDDFFQDDDDDKLKELAKKFEEKYAPTKNIKGKKRKHSLDDLVDIGFGYDETDPFVDNSEAYDELVPSDWTTQYGGFYVNQGDLHYRKLSEVEADGDANDFKIKKKKPTTKKLKTKDGLASLSKTPKELSTQKRKKQLLSKERRQKKLEKTLEAGKIKKAKKPKSLKNMGLLTLQACIKSSEVSSTKTEVKSQPVPNGVTEKKTTGITTAVISRAVVDKSQTQNEQKLPSEPNHCTVSSSASKLINKVPGVVKKSAESTVDSTTNLSLTLDTSVQQIGVNGTTNDTTGEVKIENASQPPKLPSDLPPELMEQIEYLKSESSCTTDGKSRFFNPSVNKSLLFIAKACQQLQCKLRSVVYEYLAFYLPCTKETLTKRAKSLMIQDQTDQLDQPMKALREAIEESMPQQKQRYDEEIAKAVTEQVREQMKQSGLTPKDADSQEQQSEKEVTVAEKAEQSPATPTEEKAKKALPKRKFFWTDRLRSLLCDVVSIKVQLFKMSKTRSMTAEEYIKDFLEADVRKLWPKGWMTSRILYKESKGAHQAITQPLQKTKKVTKKSDANLSASPISKEKSQGSSDDEKKPSVSPRVHDNAVTAPTKDVSPPRTTDASLTLSIAVTAASKIKSALSCLLSPTVANSLTTSSVQFAVASTHSTDSIVSGSKSHTTVAAITSDTRQQSPPHVESYVRSTKVPTLLRSEPTATTAASIKFEKDKLVHQIAHALHSLPHTKPPEVPRLHTDHSVLSHGISSMLSNQDSKSRESQFTKNLQTAEAKSSMSSPPSVSKHKELIRQVSSDNSSGSLGQTAKTISMMSHHDHSAANESKNHSALKFEYPIKCIDNSPSRIGDVAKESVIKGNSSLEDSKRTEKPQNISKAALNVSAQSLKPKIGHGQSANGKHTDVTLHRKLETNDVKDDVTAGHSKDTDQYFPATDLSNLEMALSDFAELEAGHNMMMSGASAFSGLPDRYLSSGNSRTSGDRSVFDVHTADERLGSSTQQQQQQHGTSNLPNNQVPTVVQHMDCSKSPSVKSAVSPFDTDRSSIHRFTYPAPKVTSSSTIHPNRNTPDNSRNKSLDTNPPFDFASGLSLLSAVSSIKSPQATVGKGSSSKVQTPPKSARQSPKSSTTKRSSPSVSRTSPLLGYLGGMETQRSAYAHHLASDVLVGQSLPSLVSDPGIKASMFGPGAALSSLPSSIALSSPQRFHSSLVSPNPSLQGSSQKLMMQQPQLPSALTTPLLNYPLQQQQQQQQLQLQSQGKGLASANPFAGLQGSPNTGNADQYQGQYPNFRPTFK